MRSSPDCCITSTRSNGSRLPTYALRRDAAPESTVRPGQTYGQALEENLLDLSDRLARGGYHPEPVKRVYIDKADGSKRPLGVPALEDKIVQRASVEVLGAIYEQDFIGFSYGFRPGRSAHNALDAVAVGVSARKVNWVLDADIAKFFDTIEHDWLVKFIEHRVADTRVVRLIKQVAERRRAGRRTGSREVSWGRCRAGASVRCWPTSTCTTRSTCGSSSGGGATPGVATWSRALCRRLGGRVPVPDDAERFKCAVDARLGQFGLELHPRKDAADRVRALRAREPAPPGTRQT